jgi:enoyl-[acyl-carrier protein] reductase III
MRPVRIRLMPEPEHEPDVEEELVSDNRTLEGKVALVTGGSRGIGRGISLRLAERGATVIINYLRDDDSAKATLQQIESAGGRAALVRADVSEAEQVSALMNEVRDHERRIDIFVHNALGDLLGFMAPPLTVTPSQWDTAYRCQSRAFLVGVQEASSLLNDGGRVVALSYWPGSHLGGFLPYAAMGSNKAATEAMCRYFAVALAPRGITVNAVCPGLTDDSIVNALPQEAQDAILGWLRSGWNPMGRPGTPADVAGAVAALCSQDASWITGQTIVVDGGASLMSPEMPLDFQRP